VNIYAHRGDSANLPENTLTAFARAIEIGSDGIELDVHATSDGVPVVIHDRSLMRTSGIDLNVDEILWNELRERADSVPTLAEVLSLVGDSLHLDLEVKQSGIAESVLEVLSKAPHVGWSISSFDWDTLRSVREHAPAADLWLLGLVWNTEMERAAADLGGTCAALYDSVITEATVKAVHAAGLQVMVWTVNDVNRGAQLEVWGVDALCTDNPTAFISG
jgi:glycerophosphoryl diester phosphodiesterase